MQDKPSKVTKEETPTSVSLCNPNSSKLIVKGGTEHCELREATRHVYFYFYFYFWGFGEAGRGEEILPSALRVARIAQALLNIWFANNPRK
jgi:hypothetical protein